MSPSQPDIRTDQQLIDAIRDGETGAFDVLYWRHRDSVLRIAVRLTGHDADALDVLQETFGFLVRRLRELTLTASLTSFLYPAIRNFAIEAARKRRRMTSDSDESLVGLPAVAVSRESTESPLAETLAALSPAHREVLLMRFVDDLTIPEIAAALDIPEGTAKSRLHHAINGVRESRDTVEKLRDMTSTDDE